MSSLVVQNPWWRGSERIESDRQIVDFNNCPIKWNPRIRHFFDLNSKAIYTLRGPRQVGKTTLVKLMIRRLLGEGVSPRRIFYYTCDLIEGPTKLVSIIEEYLGYSERYSDSTRFIFLDEISAVRDWQKGIKYLSDLGRFSNATVLMTGSHNLDIRKAAERLPGRRGRSEKSVDKILLPMKFAEYIESRDEELASLLRDMDLLRFDTRKKIIEDLEKGIIPPTVKDINLYFNKLSQYFEEYLLTGGIVRAINDYFTHGFITEETYMTYVQVTIGDILRWNKREIYLAQLIRRINESLCSQVSWRSLQKNTDIGSQNTVAEYVDVLKESFVLSPFYVLDRGKDGPNYGSNKKIHFHDPFIFHALRGWIRQSPYYETALEFIRSNEKTKLVECIIGDHLVRFAFSLNPIDTFEPTSHVMYWKDKRNEVDFVVKYGDDYMPFEVKYSSSFSRRDINGVYNFTKGGSKYKGIIVTKDLLKVTNGVVAVPAPVLLTLF